LPWLTALVVRRDSRRPSADWSGTWSDGTPLESEQLWRMAVSQVMAYPHWDKIAL
jgi:hypothetical protein